MAGRPPPLRIRKSTKPGVRPGRAGIDPLEPDEVFIQFGDGLLMFLQDDGTLAVMSMNVAAEAIHLLDAPAPTSTDDPAGVPGDVIFSGGCMYRKTSLGWLRFAGETF